MPLTRLVNAVDIFVAPESEVRLYASKELFRIGDTVIGQSGESEDKYEIVDHYAETAWLKKGYYLYVLLPSESVNHTN